MRLHAESLRRHISVGHGNILSTVTDTAEPFLSDLVHAGLLEPVWVSEMDARFRRSAETILAGGSAKWQESDVTATIALLDGPAQRAVVTLLCAAAGIDQRPGLRLVEGTDFRREWGRLHGRDGDLFLERRNIDVVVVDGLYWAPVIAVEAKFDASCNGRTGYCSTNPQHTWSNQVVCYLHGCTHPALDVDKGVKFLWLSLDDDAALGSPLERVRAGLTARDLEVYAGNAHNLAPALTRQTEALPQWRNVSWRALHAALRDELGDPAEPLNRLLQPVGSAQTQ
jgi:hypothetical protein